MEPTLRLETELPSFATTPAASWPSTIGALRGRHGRPYWLVGISNKVWGGKKTKHLGVRGLGRSLVGLGDVQYAVQVLDNEVPNCPVGPVVDIRATDSNGIHPQKNLMKECLNTNSSKVPNLGLKRSQVHLCN